MVKNYSQIGQDLFVLELLGENRTFLDFGCGNGRDKPCGNNTFLLEQKGWNGFSFDISDSMILEFQYERNTFSCATDLTIDLRKKMIAMVNQPLIDYLSFDVDEATDSVLDNFPFDLFEFKFITFEHNQYHQGYQGLKDRSIALFQEKGYKLLVENVMFSGWSVEDWYINPKYIDIPKLGSNISSEEALNKLKEYKNET
jgi:SAM-dependent methyltransferase